MCVAKPQRMPICLGTTLMGVTGFGLVLNSALSALQRVLILKYKNPYT